MKRFIIIKYLGIILTCVLLDIVLHVFTSAYSTIPEASNFNFLVNLIGTEFTAILWAILAFSGVAFTFHVFQKVLPGAGIKKGLRFGLAISLLWLFAMLEGVSLFGNPLIKEFVVGLSDAIPVILMGLLLGAFTQQNVENNQMTTFSIKQKLTAILLFSSLFSLGRYTIYYTGLIQSGIHSSPFQTFWWTLLMGTCIGVSFILLGSATRHVSVELSAIKFGFILFGVNWIVFLAFMPMLFNGFLIDFLLRCTADLLIVTLGYYILMKGFIYRHGMNIYYFS